MPSSAKHLYILCGRLVRDKEGMRRRLEEEERDFLGRKREYVNSIIQFEKQVFIALLINTV